jgi:hypothetical protein
VRFGGAQLRQGGKGVDEVLVDVAAEVGRVVAVDGGAQAGCSSAGRLCSAMRLEDAQLDVGQRAHRQRHARRRQALHQRRVFGAAHAVVDALHLQHVQRSLDVGRRAFFAGMGHEVQAEFAAAREHARELLRRVAAFAAVQAHADEVFRQGSACSSVAKASSSLRWRRKAQDQLALMPSSAGAAGRRGAGPG